jgi:hypothetical protein
MFGVQHPISMFRVSGRAYLPQTPSARAHAAAKRNYWHPPSVTAYAPLSLPPSLSHSLFRLTPSSAPLHHRLTVVNRCCCCCWLAPFRGEEGRLVAPPTHPLLPQAHCRCRGGVSRHAPLSLAPSFPRTLSHFSYQHRADAEEGQLHALHAHSGGMTGHPSGTKHSLSHSSYPSQAHCRRRGDAARTLGGHDRPPQRHGQRQNTHSLTRPTHHRRTFDGTGMGSGTGTRACPPGEGEGEQEEVGW